MPDQRRDYRISTNAAGFSRIDGKVIPVFLRNRSAEGARLRARSATALPDRFHLVVVAESIDRDCVVVWRRGSDCGVKFE
jgi:hypothetical protein